MILRFFCPSRFLRRSGHIALPGLSYRFIRLSCAPFPWANPATARGATPSRPLRMVWCRNRPRADRCGIWAPNRLDCHTLRPELTYNSGWYAQQFSAGARLALMGCHFTRSRPVMATGRPLVILLARSAAPIHQYSVFPQSAPNSVDF